MPTQVGCPESGHTRLMQSFSSGTLCALEGWESGIVASNYNRITPTCDLGKKQPRKNAIAKQIEICKKSNTPVRKVMNPGFATQYSPEFFRAFRNICEIYSHSNFFFPEKQILILMLDNNIYPCRADKFSEAIVKRLAGDIFNR